MWRLCDERSQEHRVTPPNVSPWQRPHNLALLLKLTQNKKRIDQLLLSLSLSLSLQQPLSLSLFHSFINLYDIRAQFISLQFSTPPSLSLSFFLNFTHKHLFTFVLLVLGCKRLSSLPLFLFLRSHLQAFLIWFFSLLANPPFTLSRFHNPLAHEQCDQMVRFFFNIWPFVTMQTCPIAYQYDKVGLKMAKY